MFKRLLLFTFLFIFEYSVIEAREISQSDIIECIPALQNNYPIESEQKMKRYHRRPYIAGLDNTNENLKLAQSLRIRSIHSHTTHIQEFSDLIDIYIAFIKKGIESQKSDDKAERLELLKLFQTEAQSRQDLKAVTYRWWINFNFRLSILATPKEHRQFNYFGKWTTNEELEELYVILKKKKRKNLLLEETGLTGDLILQMVDLSNNFPEAVLIPTKHDLGIIPINKTHGTGMHLIGLNNNLIHADEQDMYPDQFFLHDIEHTLYKYIDNSQFLTYLKRKLRNLKKPQREAAEYIYFEVTHERVYMLKDLKDLTNIRKIINSLMNRHHRACNTDRYDSRVGHTYIDFFLPLIPNYSTRICDSIGSFITKGAETFTNLILEVHKELT